MGEPYTLLLPCGSGTFGNLSGPSGAFGRPVCGRVGYGSPVGHSQAAHLGTPGRGIPDYIRRTPVRRFGNGVGILCEYILTCFTGVRSGAAGDGL